MDNQSDNHDHHVHKPEQVNTAEPSNEAPLKVWRFTDFLIILFVASLYLLPSWTGLLWLFGPIITLPIIILLGLRIFKAVWRFIAYRKSKNSAVMRLRIVDAIMLAMCGFIIFSL